MGHYPVFLELAGRPVLIVGGGNVALEKLHSLLPSGARITVVAPEALPEIQDRARNGEWVWIPRGFEEADVLGAFISIAATDDPEVNARVFAACERHLKPANSADDLSNCNFIMAAIARSGPVQAAVSSGGCSPALAQRIRNRIQEEMLAAETGDLAEFLGSWRPAVKVALSGYKSRQAFWEAVLDSEIPDVLARDGRGAADDQLFALLARHKADRTESRQGKVTLIGAGPGDPDLITVKGLKALRKADVILYDRLANPALLKHARKSALLIDVGKVPGDKGQPRQETIHALLIEHAKRGRNVARLKGGDPFVFGRGGEEMEACRDQGIPVEVVPGISSAIAVPASAGIPVTLRGVSTGFGVFTAQSADCGSAIPWDVVARLPTAVLLMGVERLPEVVERLREHGRAPETPVAVISRGTCEDQRVAVGTLETIVERAMGLAAPAAIVVGEVVHMSRGPSNELRALEPPCTVRI